MSDTDSFAYRPQRWPLIAAMLAILAGAVMLGGAAWGHRYAGRIAAEQSAPAAKTSPAGTEPSTRAQDAAIVAPPDAMHLSDMRTVFKLADERHLLLPSVDYQTEANRPAGVLFKRVVFHVDDEYPKVKAFVAELLRIFPHGQLDEIQIEQASGSAPQPAGRIQATIHLSLVYRTDEAAAAMKRAASGT